MSLIPSLRRHYPDQVQTGMISDRPATGKGHQANTPGNLPAFRQAFNKVLCIKGLRTGTKIYQKTSKRAVTFGDPSAYHIQTSYL